MTIQTHIDELESIKAEIKRNNELNKTLRVRCKVVESEIEEFLKVEDQTAVRYKDTNIVLESKVSHARKDKKTIEEEAVRLLTNMGVSNASGVYGDLQSLQKGEEVEKTHVRIFKNKSKK